MRMVSLAGVLALAATAQAQVGGTHHWVGAPRQLNFTPVDTSRAIGASNLNTAFRSPSPALNTKFSLTNMMPSVSMPSWPPKMPQVSLLPQSQNQFQPNPIKGGVNPLTPKKK